MADDSDDKTSEGALSTLGPRSPNFGAMAYASPEDEATYQDAVQKLNEAMQRRLDASKNLPWINMARANATPETTKWGMTGAANAMGAYGQGQLDAAGQAQAIATMKAELAQTQMERSGMKRFMQAESPLYGMAPPGQQAPPQAPAQPPQQAPGSPGMQPPAGPGAPPPSMQPVAAGPAGIPPPQAGAPPAPPQAPPQQAPQQPPGLTATALRQASARHAMMGMPDSKALGDWAQSLQPDYKLGEGYIMNSKTGEITGSVPHPTRSGFFVQPIRGDDGQWHVTIPPGAIGVAQLSSMIPAMAKLPFETISVHTPDMPAGVNKTMTMDKYIQYLTDEQAKEAAGTGQPADLAQIPPQLQAQRDQAANGLRAQEGSPPISAPLNQQIGNPQQQAAPAAPIQPPAGPAGMPGITTGVSKTSEEEQAARGKRLDKESEDQSTTAANAQLMNARIEQMQQQLAQFTPGATAEARLGIARYTKGFLQAIGASDDQATKVYQTFLKGTDVASMQEFGKLAMQSAFEQVRKLSSRPAVQEIGYALNSNPSLTMDRSAINRIFEFTKGLNDYEVMANQKRQEWYETHGHSTDGFEPWLQKTIPPAQFLQQRAAKVINADIASGAIDRTEGLNEMARIMHPERYLSAPR
jgi:hypothetical protein